jgi:hypothetical protein
VLAQRDVLAVPGGGHVVEEPRHGAVALARIGVEGPVGQPGGGHPVSHLDDGGRRDVQRGGDLAGRAAVPLPQHREQIVLSDVQPMAAASFSGLGIEWAAGFATLINGRDAGHGHGVAMLTKERASGLPSCHGRAYLLGPQRRVHRGKRDGEGSR